MRRFACQCVVVSSVRFFFSFKFRFRFTVEFRFEGTDLAGRPGEESHRVQIRKRRRFAGVNPRLFLSWWHYLVQRAHGVAGVFWKLMRRFACQCVW